MKTGNDRKLLKKLFKDVDTRKKPTGKKKKKKKLQNLINCAINMTRQLKNAPVN